MDLQLCTNPVFIIGSPRSGTTILAWSLARHTALWTSGESYLLFDFYGNGRAEKVYERARELSQGSWIEAQKVSREEFLRSLGIGVNSLFTSRSGGRIWIDHTPHYALMVDVLAEMFPSARFLHILRDGREVVRSMQSFLNLFKKDPQREEMIKSGAVSPWATNFRKACETWRDYTEAAMQFASKRPERCFTVRHDQLREDPRGMFGRILDFLQLAYEEGPAEYFQSHRLNSSFGRAAQTGGKTESSDDPWADWTAEQRSIFADVAGATLLRCGLGKVRDTTCAEYDRLIQEIRRIVTSELPSDAKLVVVSRGDAQLQQFGGSHAAHFPQTEDGEWAGYHPADGAEAISALEWVRSKGAEYLLIPNTAFWWLDYYPSFHAHLDACCSAVWRSDECLIYRLQGPQAVETEMSNISGVPESSQVQ